MPNLSTLPAVDPGALWSAAAQRTYDREVDNDTDYQTLSTFLDIAGNGALLLDMGCGFGRYVPMIEQHNARKRAGIRYVGVDCADGMLEIARREFPDSDFRKGYWGKIGEVATETFDAFVANRSIGLLTPSEVAAALIELRSRLRKGAVGMFVVDYGTESQTFGHSERNPHIPKGMQATFHTWTPQELKPLLDAAQLRGGLVRHPCGCHFELFVDAV